MPAPPSGPPIYTPQVEDPCNICFNSAAQFCICTDDFPNVCIGCEERHKKESVAIHWMFPIEAKAQATSVNESKFVENKVLYYLSAERKLRNNLKEVQRCKEVIEANFVKTMDSVKELLSKRKEEEIARLTDLEASLRKEIDFALEEVKSHLLDSDFCSESEVSNAVFDYNDLEDAESLNLFQFERREVALDSEWVLGVEWECRLMDDRKIRNAWLRVGARQLAVIHTNNVCFYTPATRTKIKVSLSENIKHGDFSTWTFLPNNDLLVFGHHIGGGYGSTEAI